MTLSHTRSRSGSPSGSWHFVREAHRYLSREDGPYAATGFDTPIFAYTYPPHLTKTADLQLDTMPLIPHGVSSSAL